MVHHLPFNMLVVVMLLDLILAKREDGEIWSVALAGTEDFSNLIKTAPDSFIAQEAKPFLDPLSTSSLAQTTIYEFPWVPGNWEYRNGWHSSALDIGTRGTADKRVLASADGYITFICEGTQSANVHIRHSDGRTLEYFHINITQLASGIEEGKPVLRGQLLGTLRSGHWSYDGCGQAPSQSDDSAHLHWVIPLGPGNSIEVDGWTINYGNDTWTKGTSTVVADFAISITTINK